MRSLSLLANLVPLLLFTWISPALAGSDGTPTFGSEQPAVNTNGTNPIPASISAETPNLGNQILPQNGTIFNDGNLNGACSSTGCIQLGVKHSQPVGSASSTEYSINATFPLGSPDSTRVKMTEINNQATISDVQGKHKRLDEEATNAQRRELNQALSNHNISHAILIAKQLAPKLGYADHWKLLDELGWNKSRIETAQISPIPTNSIVAKAPAQQKPPEKVCLFACSQ
jgi:hypothetical protein